jgi:hypothetical protein
MVKAWVDPTVNEYGAWATEVDPGAGRYAGLGHNNTGHLNHFDNFYMEEIRTSTEICVPCFCQCETFTVPSKLLATIINATGGNGRATCLNGKTWDMDFYNTTPTPRPQVVQWIGGFTESSEIMEWILSCGTGAATTFSLYWNKCGHKISDGPPEVWNNCSLGLTVESCDNDPSWMALAGSTCTPLSLVFGPFPLSFTFHCDLCDTYNSPGGCVIPHGVPGHTDVDCDGTYYIEITEQP